MHPVFVASEHSLHEASHVNNEVIGLEEVIPKSAFPFVEQEAMRGFRRDKKRISHENS